MITARYTIIRGRSEFTVELPCTVHQDAGICFTSELLVLWSPEADALFVEHDFDPEELVGAVEAAEAAHWASERETCRLLKVKQQLGTAAA